MNSENKKQVLLSDNTQKILFWAFLFATVGFALWTKKQISPLTSNEIVDFELAHYLENAKNILNNWDENHRQAFALSIKLDYGFIVLYSLSLFIGCNYLGKKVNNSLLTPYANLFGIFGILAGIFDTIENINMTKSLANLAESSCKSELLHGINQVLANYRVFSFCSIVPNNTFNKINQK